MNYTLDALEQVQEGFPDDFDRVVGMTKLSEREVDQWKKVAHNMYFPFSEKYGVYLQQDGFLDKEMTTVDKLADTERPINQHWSWV